MSNKNKTEDLEKKCEYRIEVIEDNSDVTYFADTIDISKVLFVTFAPRYQFAKNTVKEVNGVILTFPSQLVKKITHYIRA